MKNTQIMCKTVERWKAWYKNKLTISGSLHRQCKRSVTWGIIYSVSEELETSRDFRYDYKMKNTISLICDVTVLYQRMT